MRPMDATLEGYAWLPRLIDKARLARAGELGDIVHPCPVDRRCMGLLGIDVATLHAIVDREPTTPASSPPCAAGGSRRRRRPGSTRRPSRPSSSAAADAACAQRAPK